MDALGWHANKKVAKILKKSRNIKQSKNISEHIVK